MNAASLFVGFLASALGLAYFVYGKRQARFVPLLSGIGLCVYTWFVTSWVWLAVIGIAFAVAPFLIDL